MIVFKNNDDHSIILIKSLREYNNFDNGNSTNRKKRDSPCGENENDILRCMSSHGDGGTFDPDEDGMETDIDIGVRSNFITIYISEAVKLEVKYETIVSLALLQFPAVCLALFGVFEAFRIHGFSCPAVKNCFSAMLVIFLPFCFVEFFVLFEFEFSQDGLNFVLDKIKKAAQKVFDVLCGKCSESCIQSMDLLHFLPSKEADKRDKMPSVEMIKIVFCSCLLNGLE